MAWCEDIAAAAFAAGQGRIPGLAVGYERPREHSGIARGDGPDVALAGRGADAATPMHPALPFALAAALAVLVYGLLAWERIVRRRRAEQPGTG